MFEVVQVPQIGHSRIGASAPDRPQWKWCQFTASIMFKVVQVHLSDHSRIGAGAPDRPQWKWCRGTRSTTVELVQVHQINHNGSGASIPSPNYIWQGFKSDSQAFIRDPRSMRQLPVSHDSLMQPSSSFYQTIIVLLPLFVLPVHYQHHPSSSSHSITSNSWSARSPQSVQVSTSISFSSTLICSLVHVRRFLVHSVPVGPTTSVAICHPIVAHVNFRAPNQSHR
jgi:hypothetical protein